MDNLKLFIQELREIIGDKFDFSIEINNIDFTVWFSYEEFEDYEIPITYATCEEFSYFDKEKFLDKMKYNKIELKDIEYGFDSDEIDLMDKLCKYLEKNKDIIKEITDIMERVQ